MGKDGIAAQFHRCKKIENYLLGRPTLVRALELQIYRRHVDNPEDLGARLEQRLYATTNPMRVDCSGQLVASYCEFHRHKGKD